MVIPNGGHIISDRHGFNRIRQVRGVDGGSACRAWKRFEVKLFTEFPVPSQLSHPSPAGSKSHSIFREGPLISLEDI